ncbi:DUF692 family protein [Hymenobacter sediminis]|nr:DUF692 family protein [Hymenobacter sediminis]
MAEGRVEALEWSFDALFWAEQVPDWFSELLTTYSAANRLLGHGVYFSLLSGRWTPEQQQWLEQVRQVVAQYPLAHLTEHFGFFTGQNFHSGAPLPVPYTPATLRLGQDRLSRIYEACRCPVGLENLAFAYSLDEVKRHGEFLGRLLEPVNGFLILDLHNLYCQIHNFSVSYEELIGLYPLERVREIHISGGSWENSELAPGRKIRRDTHDEGVPEEVFQLLELTIPRCPRLKYVVLEQLGPSLKTEESRIRFRHDFGRMEEVVHRHRAGRLGYADAFFLPPQPLQTGPALEDAQLHAHQQQLSHILETAPSFAEAQRQLHASALASSDWKLEQWAPYMLETAVSIAQKWK